MGESVEQNIIQRQLLRQLTTALAGSLDGEAKDRFVEKADAIVDRSNPAPSAASKRKAFRVVE